MRSENANGKPRRAKQRNLGLLTMSTSKASDTSRPSTAKRMPIIIIPMSALTFARDFTLPEPPIMAERSQLEVGKDIPTRLEIQRIIDAAGQGRALLLTAALTGIRASELRGLRWSDVDLAKREINVRQRADRYQKIGHPKST